MNTLNRPSKEGFGGSEIGSQPADAPCGDHPSGVGTEQNTNLVFQESALATVIRGINTLGSHHGNDVSIERRSFSGIFKATKEICLFAWRLLSVTLTLYM